MIQIHNSENITFWLSNFQKQSTIFLLFPYVARAELSHDHPAWAVCATSDWQRSSCTYSLYFYFWKVEKQKASYDGANKPLILALKKQSQVN